VLVVDDEPAIRLLCRVNLELDGYAVREAATIGDARALLDAESVALVLLDLHIGNDRGETLLAELRGREPRIPVVVVTGSSDVDRGEQRLDADALLGKPFTIEALLGAVRTLANGGSSTLARMSATAVRTPADYETRLQQFYFERSEEGRAVRVGEKEVSEQAAIVARYTDLFSRPQVEALREAEQSAGSDERERLYRLRKTCEAGIISAELAEQEDAFENAILGARVTFEGEEMPLRSAQARLAVLESYAGREALGELERATSAGFNPERLALLAAWEQLEGELSGEPDPVARNEEEKAISLRQLERVLIEAADATADAYGRLRERWFDKLLGSEREPVPSNAHVHYLRRLSPLESTYTKERCVDVCMASVRALGFDMNAIPNIRLDLEDRPQKNPRACVIASDPPEVVHLITRAQGGLHDYQAFMHEAGHALHYAGVDPRLPYTFRRIARDHALTEIYSYIFEAITREPAWHALHFGLSDEQAEENAQATLFLEALLYRRYTAKLRYELGFWSNFAEEGGRSPRDYATQLTEATGIRYDPRGYVADMDSGFYSADYLRAWIRSAQLRAHLIREIGEDWWRSEQTGEILRDLFAEGTRPTSEEIAGRLGFDPFDTGPLVADLSSA
jgi:DNA-binding response OmpR family regulator